ncbi:hypothetical protein CORC01_01211, partial [Colletotrichum orchidophilum]
AATLEPKTDRASRNRQKPIGDPAIKISDNRSLPRQACLQDCLHLANDGLRAGGMNRNRCRPVRRRWAWRVSAGS